MELDRSRRTLIDDAVSGGISGIFVSVFDDVP